MQRILLVSVAAAAVAFVGVSAQAKSKLTVTPIAPVVYGEWYGNPGPVHNAAGQCWRGNGTGNGRDVLNGYWGDCPAPTAYHPITPYAEWYGNPGPVRKGDMCWRGNGTGNGRDVLNGYWAACPRS